MKLGDGLYLFQSKLGWILGGRYLAATDFDSVQSLLVGTIGVAPTGIKPQLICSVLLTHQLSVNLTWIFSGILSPLEFC